MNNPIFTPIHNNPELNFVKIDLLPLGMTAGKIINGRQSLVYIRFKFVFLQIELSRQPINMSHYQSHLLISQRHIFFIHILYNQLDN